MAGKMYRTLGLSLPTWSLIEEARRHPAFLEVYGRLGGDSDAIEWLIRGGIIRLRTDPVFQPALAEEMR